jgi:Predicted glycosyltransferases
MKTKRFAIVVAAHRDYAALELCIRGLSKAVESPSDLIFVDNGSGGILAEQMTGFVPGITTIILPENRNFCGGYNAGIRHAMERDFDFVLIVNADTEVIKTNFVTDLIHVTDRHPRAAFVGPLVCYRDRSTVQQTCLTFPSILHSILVWLPFRLLPDVITRQSKKEQTIDFLNGVCVLCRVDALQEIGLMDENFGGYVEDADWAWRAHMLGWDSLFAPVSSIIHHEETHGYEHYSQKSFLLRRNTIIWFLKAGKRRSARLYAAISLALAKIRAALSRQQDRVAYSEYASNFEETCRQLFSLHVSYAQPVHELESSQPAASQQAK